MQNDVKGWQALIH